MELLEKFKKHINQKNLFSPKDKLLLAVSGGVDSVVLCELCNQAGFEFDIAHCNFQLRGEESDRDELFVKNKGKKYNKEVLIKKFDTENYAKLNKLSIQEAARELRYSWFEELAASQQARYLLTAHHGDDNAETLLMNFFRGTGMHGLTAIPDSIKYIRRPLLEFSKDELIGFASENKLEFVEDSSNQSSKYTRNFFRNEIIPAISKIYPQVKENLQDNINRFKEIDRLYQLAVSGLKKKICKKKGNEIHIPVKQLIAFNNRALIYEIISPYSFHEKQVDEVIKLAGSGSGKYIQSSTGNYRVIRHRHWFIISPVRATDSENIVIESGDKEINFSLGNLYVEITGNIKQQAVNIGASLDAREITFPLLLRKWKTGDYFYPLGMKKKKKLSRFFIDQKLSKSEKEKVWVVESGQRIAWVVGYRIDERFKVTDKTKNVLNITLKTEKN
ncbi:MAG: tRNA lysidine(34) synthetase TilS [Chitinophagaceae bacterium]